MFAPLALLALALPPGAGGLAPVPDDSLGAPPGASRLTAAEPDRVLGVVAEGAAVEAAFVLTNPGPGAVALRGVEAGCSCQSAGGLPGVLAAGASATLNVSMTTRDRRGETRGWWDIYHETPDGATRALRLTLTATVTAAGKLEPDPPVISLGAVEYGEAVNAAVTLTERDPAGAAVKIIKIDAPDWLAVRVQEPADGSPGYRLELTGTPPAEPGRVAGAVTVGTDHPAYSQIEIPFEGFVRGRAAVEPGSLVQIVGPGARPAVAHVRPRNGATITGVVARLVPAGGPDAAGEAIPVSAGPDGAWALSLPAPPAAGPAVERRVLNFEITTDAGVERHSASALILRPAG